MSYEDMVDELRDYFGDTLMPGEATAKQLYQDVEPGVSLRAFKAFLDRMVDRGEWVVRKVVHEGRVINAYKKAETPPQE